MYIEDRTITLNLWDTAGQEKFKSLIPTYIKDSHAIIVVYDITNLDSFNNLEQWIDDARALRDIDQAQVVVAGNKSDRESERQVEKNTVETFCAEKGFPHFDISALTGENINSMFNELSKRLTGVNIDLIKTNNNVSSGYEGSTQGQTESDANNRQ